LNETLSLALIVFAAVGSQLFAARFRLPAIVPLLAAGVLLGPYVADAIDPDTLFGDLIDPFVALAVGAILFDGALALRREDLAGGVGVIVGRLISLGVMITWVLAAVGAALVLGLDHRIAILLGAVLTLSGPTVVLPLLDFVRPTPRPASILRWEGIMVDPIGAILAVLTFHAISSGGGAVEVGGFVGTIAIGTAFGLAGAVLLAMLLSTRRFDIHLEATATLAIVLLAVALASEAADDAGLVTAIAMGVTLAHRRQEIIERAPDFSGTLVGLLLGVLFVILSARVDPAAVIDLGFEGLAFVAFLILLVRPLSTLACTARSRASMRERALVAWMMPRGIVAAATASTFELGLEQHQIPDADLLVPATFFVITLTVVVYGLTARPVALRLGVAERDPPTGHN
jgi:NhaP-type Na+/H+ or K+/H+ antiporter